MVSAAGQSCMGRHCLLETGAALMSLVSQPEHRSHSDLTVGLSFRIPSSDSSGLFSSLSIFFLHLFYIQKIYSLSVSAVTPLSSLIPGLLHGMT